MNDNGLAENLSIHLAKDAEMSDLIMPKKILIPALTSRLVKCMHKLFDDCVQNLTLEQVTHHCKVLSGTWMQLYQMQTSCSDCTVER
jgi:hypothetical protein